MKLLALFRIEAVLTLRQLPFVFLSILMIAAAFFVSLPASLMGGKGIRDIMLAVVSEASPDFTKMLIGMTADYDIIRNVYIAQDMEEADNMLENGQADIVLHIPQSIEHAYFQEDDIIINLKANDVFIGTVAYRLADSTISAVNELGKIVNYVDERANKNGGLERTNELSIYSNQLILDTIVRYTYLNTITEAATIDSILLSFLQFLIASVTAIFTAVLAAKQISQGYIRRLIVHRYNLLYIIINKLCISVIVSLLIAVLASAFLRIHHNPVRFCVSVVLLTVIITGLCLPLVSVSSRVTNAAAYSVLGCATVLLFMIFAGGGFYPSYLMRFSLRGINPAWLSSLLAIWSLRGTFPPARLFMLIIPLLMVCIGITLLKWRKRA